MFDREVDEIRARRKKLIKDNYDGDINKLIDEAIEWEKDNPDRVTSPKIKNKLTTI